MTLRHNLPERAIGKAVVAFALAEGVEDEVQKALGAASAVGHEPERFLQELRERLQGNLTYVLTVIVEAAAHWVSQYRLQKRTLYAPDASAASELRLLLSQLLLSGLGLIAAFAVADDYRKRWAKWGLKPFQTSVVAIDHDYLLACALGERNDVLDQEDTLDDPDLQVAPALRVTQRGAALLSSRARADLYDFFTPVLNRAVAAVETAGLDLAVARPAGSYWELPAGPATFTTAELRDAAATGRLGAVWDAAGDGIEAAFTEYPEHALIALISGTLRTCFNTSHLLALATEGGELVGAVLELDACPDCERLLDGETFDPQDLLDNAAKLRWGVNTGPKCDWIAAPVIHHHCRCTWEAIAA